MDVLAEALRQETLQQQASLDRSVAHLLALQMEGGLKVHNGDNDDEDEDNNNNSNKSAKETEIEKEQEQVKQNIELLRRELQDKETLIAGTHVRVVRDIRSAVGVILY
jgi:TATA-binding protein-associated factor Taf7